MTTELTIMEDPGPSSGAAMARITPLQRRFVMALLMLGDLNHSQAARLAGCKCCSAASFAVAAHQMFHKPLVQEAIHEQAKVRLASAQIMAASHLVKMANESTNEVTKLKALTAILNRTGHHEVTEHHVHATRVNVNIDQDLQELATLAKNSGVPLSPEMQKLLERKSNVIDITPAPADPDDDILGVTYE